MGSFVKYACAAALGAFVLSSAPAQAANTCTERDRLVGFLSDKYKETPRAMGLVSNSGVMEVYVSSQGSWTIVVTSSKGMSCVIAAGENWEDMRVALKDDPAA
jgi:hypothetical protein